MQRISLDFKGSKIHKHRIAKDLIGLQTKIWIVALRTIGHNVFAGIIRTSFTLLSMQKGGCSSTGHEENDEVMPNGSATLSLKKVGTNASSAQHSAELSSTQRCRGRPFTFLQLDRSRHSRQLKIPVLFSNVIYRLWILFWNPLKYYKILWDNKKSLRSYEVLWNPLWFLEILL